MKFLGILHWTYNCAARWGEENTAAAFRSSQARAGSGQSWEWGVRCSSVWEKGGDWKAAWARSEQTAEQHVLSRSLCVVCCVLCVVGGATFSVSSRGFVLLSRTLLSDTVLCTLLREKEGNVICITLYTWYMSLQSTSQTWRGGGVPFIPCWW